MSYLLARGLSEFSFQMAVVAIGWQMYALTHSAFALGMVGLVQFVPTLLLTFTAGHASDRFDRQRIAAICQLAQAVAAAVLAAGTFFGWLTVAEIYGVVALLGVATAFESPAASALLPGVAPEGLLQRSTALSTGMFNLAIICGPAIGGFAYAFSPVLPYAGMTFFWLLAALLYASIRTTRVAAAKDETSVAGLFAGVAFVRNHPAILGSISLDLFAVLLGGATALLPIYAKDILHTGPWGLGVLRGAPALGALIMTFVLARHAIQRRVGLRMFQAVIVFGAATIVFGLSHWIALSIVALAIMGAADTISMIVRISLVQLSTPDGLRGRVGAVNYLFVNASNQLGEFESGVTAALLGPVLATVAGGVGTIAIALIWMALFPALRNVERLE